MTCRVCNGSVSGAFVKRGYTVRRCRNCGYLWMTANGTSPAPVDYGKLYGETYYGSGDGAPDNISRYRLSEILETKMPQAQAAVKLLQQFQRGGRLLDVGCSAGVFVKAARDAGFQASGIDVSDVAVRFAREQLQVEACASRLEAAEFGREFDVITMWDLLEHLEDPWRAMRLVDAWLKPRGILAVRTPNTRCLRTRLAGYSSWDMISPPEHYHLFAEPSLKRFLEEAGFHLLHLETVHSDWIYYRQVAAWKKWPFQLSGAIGWGGDLVAVAQRTS